MKCLVVDDHMLFAAGIAGVLDQLEGGKVAADTCGSVEEAAACLDRQDYDLVLLDLFLPDTDGLLGMKRLLKTAQTTPIVILSASTDPENARSAVDAGAAGYITKSSSPEVLITALRRIVDDGETCVVGLDLDGAGVSPLQGLTPRQRDIAAYVARGYSNREIADETGITEGTVKLHVSSILKVLGIRNRAGLAHMLNRPAENPR